MSARRPTAEYLRSILCEPDTGALRWKRNYYRQKVGDEAGWIENSAYVRLGINGKQYVGHVIAWVIQTGEWPKHQIDHREPPRSDNRWGNLREATSNQNQHNRGAEARNSIGLKGVWQHLGSGRYRAKICVNRKQIHLGSFITPEEAHAAYCAAARKLHGKFANFGALP